jgi:heme/copper-type cytochrome/quinol oxidase subunit 2
MDYTPRGIRSFGRPKLRWKDQPILQRKGTDRRVQNLMLMLLFMFMIMIMVVRILRQTLVRKHLAWTNCNNKINQYNLMGSCPMDEIIHDTFVALKKKCRRWAALVMTPRFLFWTIITMLFISYLKYRHKTNCNFEVPHNYGFLINICEVCQNPGT